MILSYVNARAESKEQEDSYVEVTLRHSGLSLMDERQGLIAQASTLKAIYESDYSHVESKYNAPWYFAHRVDLHNSLKELALQDAGVGRPARLRLRARVVSIVSTRQPAISIGTSLDLLLGALGSKRRNCCSRQLYNL